MNAWLKRLELPITAALLFTGAAFLLKMCYLPYATCTLLGGAWLAAVYFYLRARYQIRLPPVLLFLVFAALQVDALGNFFSMYGRAVLGSVMYDEFAHLAVQALTMPLVGSSRRACVVSAPLPLSLTMHSPPSSQPLACLRDSSNLGERYSAAKASGANTRAQRLQWDSPESSSAQLAYVILRRGRNVEIGCSNLEVIACIGIQNTETQRKREGARERHGCFSGPPSVLFCLSVVNDLS